MECAIGLIVVGELQVTVVTVTVRVALFLIHVSDVTILVDCWLTSERIRGCLQRCVVQVHVYFPYFTYCQVEGRVLLGRV